MLLFFLDYYHLIIIHTCCQRTMELKQKYEWSGVLVVLDAEFLLHVFTVNFLAHDEFDGSEALDGA